MVTPSPDVVIGMRLLDVAKRHGFVFRRITPGPDGPRPRSPKKVLFAQGSLSRPGRLDVWIDAPRAVQQMRGLGEGQPVLPSPRDAVQRPTQSPSGSRSRRSCARSADGSSS